MNGKFMWHLTENVDGGYLEVCGSVGGKDQFSHNYQFSHNWNRCTKPMVGFSTYSGAVFGISLIGLKYSKKLFFFSLFVKIGHI